MSQNAPFARSQAAGLTWNGGLPCYGINSVEGCWLEEEEGGIVHIYTVTRTADYDLDQRIFQEYADIEKRFPHVSFEFLVTSLPPSPQAEVVFS